MTTSVVAPRECRTETAPLLSMRGVWKTFSRGLARAVDRTAVLRGIDLELHGGEIAGIVGDEGSGKTSLLQCAAGLLRRDAGEVRWFGKSFDGGGLMCGVAYVCAVPVYYPFLTVRDVVGTRAFRCHWSGGAAPDVEAIIMSLNLGMRADRPVLNLSRNEVKRLAVAEALASRPRALLVDTSAGDAGSAEISMGLREFACRGGAVMIAAREEASIAAVASRCAFISEGRIVCRESEALQSIRPARRADRFVAERFH